MDFFRVAVHEFGDALGLQHSTSKNDVMYAYPQAEGFNPNFKLQEENV
jgi:predicted Zn-dependent protease